MAWISNFSKLIKNVIISLFFKQYRFRIYCTFLFRIFYSKVAESYNWGFIERIHSSNTNISSSNGFKIKNWSWMECDNIHLYLKSIPNFKKMTMKFTISKKRKQICNIVSFITWVIFFANDCMGWVLIILEFAILAFE